MKHAFFKSKLDELACAICKRPELDHGSQATCEVCGKTDSCDFKSGILMCNGCATNEIDKAQAPKNSDRTIPPLQINMDSLNKLESIKTEFGNIGNIQELENKLIVESEYTEIKDAATYFNNRTISLIEMEKRILEDITINPEDKRYEMGRQVRAHVIHLKEVLFKATEIQLQAATEQRADYAYLNKLIKSLREDERAKLHLEAIEYTPKIPPKDVKVPSVRLSKTDKMIQGLADMLKITFAQAKHIYEGQLKAKGVICTCKETPGMCKVHV